MQATVRAVTDYMYSTSLGIRTWDRFLGQRRWKLSQIIISHQCNVHVLHVYSGHMYVFDYCTWYMYVPLVPGR